MPRAALVLSTVCLNLLDAHAADVLDASLSAGVIHSDNIGRSADNEDSLTTADLGLQFQLAREEGRLNANVSSDLRYRNYFDDTYNDEAIGGLAANIAYWFFPSRFSWVVQDNFGQTYIDRVAVETPDNRQQSNYFSTGPDLLLPLGARSDLVVQGRWSHITYEVTDVDNQRLSGTLGLLNRLSTRSSVSLIGTAERVEFKDIPIDDGYDRQSYYLGFSAEGARTSLAVQGGYTALRDSGETTDGPLVGVTLTRQLTARSRLNLDAGTDLTDTADAFRRDQRISGVALGNEDAVVSQDPFQSDYASVAWVLTGARSTLTLSSDWRQDDQTRLDTLDRESFGASVRLGRRFSRAVTVGVDSGWRHDEFDATNVEFEEWSVGLELVRNIAATLSVALRGDHFDGSGDTSAGDGLREYTENRVSLRLTFTPRR